MNKDKVKKNFEEILNEIPGKQNIDKSVFSDTPKRVADFYEEIFVGLTINPRDFLKNKIPTSNTGVVVIKDIDFFSMCEHHFLPFFGKIDIAYIPNGNIVGFGDIIKVIEALAKRPQLQERLSEEIAEVIYEELNCSGVCIQIEAEHLCMTMRGVKKPGSTILTLTSKGSFDDVNKRIEFLNLIKRGR